LNAFHSFGSISTSEIRCSCVVLCEAGKLGIIVDTSLEGPIVHTIKPGSPLQSQLFPGDIIVAINETDTRAMNAAGITSLMVQTARQPRVLRVMNTDGSLGQSMLDSPPGAAAVAFASGDDSGVGDGLRTITAPPGKLGIVVDSAADGEGPIIFKVKETSPLQGVLYEGDRLLKIDNVDVSQMSAAEISQIMSHRGNQKRILTVQ